MELSLEVLLNREARKDCGNSSFRWILFRNKPIIDFNISRRNVISNRKFFEFSIRLSDLIKEGFEKFFEAFKDTKTPFGPFNLDLLREKYEINQPKPSSVKVYKSGEDFTDRSVE